MVAQTRTKARKVNARSNSRVKSAAKATAKAKASDALTIPQLKQAFDYIEDFASGAPDVEDFMREWRRVFHRPIEREHASAYLDFVARESRRRTLRVHRGGAEPGVYAGQGLIPGAVTPEGLRPYGAFPSYVASGFEVSIPIPAQGTACAAGLPGLGPQDAVPAVPAVPATTGGARGRAAGREKRTLRRHRGGRIPFSTAPPSALQNMATLFRGQPMPPSASPIENPYL
jgi:hypothetical protein